MINDLLRMRTLRPSDAWAPGNISTALFLLGAPDEGDYWLAQTRQVNPDSRYLILAGYTRLFVSGKYGELTELMRDAWMREATEGNYLGLGSALLLDGKPAEAYEVLKEALAKYPFDPATGNVSLSTESAFWLILAARAEGDDALASDLLGKIGIQINNAIEQRYYVLANQPLRAAYYALSGERIRALYTLQQAADDGLALPSDLETPLFDSLKDNPDYQAILGQVRANQAAMKEKVLALDNLLPN
jgi:tetratricopeptide (TPR) repeat protein